MQKLRSIQVLRGVAAVAVVIYHATHTRFAVGAAGVDLFFVISGFLMATIAPGDGSWSFLRDRLWRILPLYFIVTAAYFALVPIGLPDKCRLMASLTLWPSWPNWCFPYVFQGWTLSYELLFYILVALSIRRLWIVALILPALVVWRLTMGFPPQLQWAGNPIILEFLGGMLLTKLPRRFGTPALLVGLCWLWLAPIETKTNFRVIAWGVPAFLIVHGALSMEKRFASDWWTAPVIIGNSSYSLYLSHAMLLRFIGGPWWAAAWFAVVGGYVVYLFIEKPLLKLRQASSRIKVRLPLNAVIAILAPSSVRSRR